MDFARIIVDLERSRLSVEGAQRGASSEMPNSTSLIKRRSINDIAFASHHRTGGINLPITYYQAVHPPSTG